MPRRREVPKRRPDPDPRFGEPLVSKFINCVMLGGKKSTSEKCVYRAFDIIEARTKEDPLMVFRKAVENVEPMVEVKSRRVGGSTYQVPVEVRQARRTALSIRWLILFARKRGGKSFADKLANELMEASHNRGSAFKKKDDIHRMAEANKPFAHYRW